MIMLTMAATSPAVSTCGENAKGMVKGEQGVVRLCYIIRSTRGEDGVSEPNKSTRRRLRRCYLRGASGAQRRRSIRTNNTIVPGTEQQYASYISEVRIRQL